MSDRLVVRVLRPELGLRDPVSRQRVPTDRPFSVPDSPFWRQRIANGDVAIADPAAAPAQAAPESVPEESEVDLEEPATYEQPRRRNRRRKG